MTDRRSDSKDEAPEPYSAEYWEHFLDDLTEEDLRCDGPHLICVDELRAAGALDFPPEWRKSLGVEKPQCTGLFREEHFAPDEPRTRPSRDDEPANWST